MEVVSIPGGHALPICSLGGIERQVAPGGAMRGSHPGGACVVAPRGGVCGFKSDEIRLSMFAGWYASYCHLCIDDYWFPMIRDYNIKMATLP